MGEKEPGLSSHFPPRTDKTLSLKGRGGTSPPDWSERLHGAGGGPDFDAGMPSPNPSRKREGDLANAFVCTANIDAHDGGAAIVAGNEKVLAARLSDAKFFWEQDLKVALDDQAITIMFDFVNPVGPGWNMGTAGWNAGLER